MKTQDILPHVQRHPFRPFTVRLSNGTAYAFTKPEELGAPEDLTTLFYFRPGGGYAIIDAENIVEILPLQ